MKPFLIDLMPHNSQEQIILNWKDMIIGAKKTRFHCYLDFSFSS